VKIPDFIRKNLLLKMTGLNAVVIVIRLIISLGIQRLLAQLVGEAGIAKVGSLRNLIQILTSITSLGVFNGVVKYLAEYRQDKPQLQKLFSTAYVFTILGSLVSAVVMLIAAEQISNYLFATTEFAYLVRLMALIVPSIAINRMFYGVINGLSDYKKFAKIDLLAYLVNAALLVIMLYTYGIDGVLIAIAVSPVLQLLVLLSIFTKVLKEYVQFRKLRFKIPMAGPLLAFSLMSFASTVLANYVEIDIRSMITRRISENQAGIWTAMTNISKNYMVFSTAIFSLYVLPKFSAIHDRKGFYVELSRIYKTLLPIFGAGMVLVYLLREYVVLIIYPDFTDLYPLFKWQLAGDFVRLAAMVLMYQFLAKKLVRAYVVAELGSLLLFYLGARFLVEPYGIEGVVMAHALRYVLFLPLVFFLVERNFRQIRRRLNG
jgi:PST family polysaccharide transporter